MPPPPSINSVEAKKPYRFTLRKTQESTCLQIPPQLQTALPVLCSLSMRLCFHLVQVRIQTFRCRWTGWQWKSSVPHRDLRHSKGKPRTAPATPSSGQPGPANRADTQAPERPDCPKSSCPAEHSRSSAPLYQFLGTPILHRGTAALEDRVEWSLEIGAHLVRQTTLLRYLLQVCSCQVCHWKESRCN